VTFVIRESCGCAYSPEQEDALQDSGAGPLPKLDPQRPLASLSAEVNREIRAGRNPMRLRRIAFPPRLREAALLAIAEGECRFHASQRFATLRRETVLGDIEASLVSSFAMEDILKEIARGARELGISGCWLILFGPNASALEWSKLFLAADNRGSRILAPFGLRFRTAELVPGGLPENWGSYVCEPLRLGSDRLGYLICTADSTDRRMYAALQDQVSSALKGAKLMMAEWDRERNLESLVRARTIALSTSNSQLLEEMHQRRRLEREILENSNRIMSRIGQDIHDNICQDIASLGIMAAVLEGKLRRAGMQEEADEAAALAKASGETAARAKGIARGLYPAELEAKGIVSAVERLIQVSKERAKAGIRLEVTEGFSVRDSEKALHLYRIVQEALNNAIKHSRPGEILVGLHMDRETVTVEVRDDGVGMDDGAREEGGMGLHILKYRASVMGGELRIRSNGQGTAVTCRVAR
jgi:signal transduction histidine kinase